MMADLEAETCNCQPLCISTIS